MRWAQIALEDLTASDRAAWAELADHAAAPNPFFRPDYVEPAAEALAPRGLRVVFCADASGWLACLPVVPARGRPDVRGPGRASWRHLYAYLGTPLVAPGAPADAVAGLLRGPRAAYTVLDWAREDGILAGLAARGPRPVTTRAFSRAFVHRDQLTMPSRSRARSVRRARRGLAAALGAEPEGRERDDVDVALAQFVALEAAGWKGREGTALAAHPGHLAFFTAMCSAFARRGALQILSLEHDHRPLAMQVNVRDGRGIFCLKVAYDEAQAQHSPGMLLEVEALERLAGDARADWMDSCADPDAELINRLWPGRTAIRTAVFPAGRLAAPVVRASSAATMRARALVRGRAAAPRDHDA